VLTLKASVRDAEGSAIGIAASALLAAVSLTCSFIEFLPPEPSNSLRKDLCSVELQW
jgi:L-rhamnonate dehydratase